MNNTINIKSRDLPVFSIVITVWHKRREFSILIDSVESVLPRRNATCKLFVWMRTQKKIPRTKSTEFTYDLKKLRLSASSSLQLFNVFRHRDTNLFRRVKTSYSLFCCCRNKCLSICSTPRQNKKIWLLLLSFCHCRFYWSRLIFW